MQERIKGTIDYSEDQKKTFDVLSSIRLYQHDLAAFRTILPETRQRVYDEELSYIAEGINLPLATEFVLHEENGQLVYFHEGKWRSYIGSLADNLNLANQEAAGDPRRQFLAERAAEDLRIGYKIAALQPGETVAFMADFPQNELDLYGEKFISDLGFQPMRKMGFLYEAEKTADGRTILRSQTVDGNDREAYAAALERGQAGGTVEDMREAYDAVMEERYGGFFIAGRRLETEVPEENAWSVIIRNKDLIEDYYMAKLEELAAEDIDEAELERSKKRLTYGVWAALKERMFWESQPVFSRPADRQEAYGPIIQQEVETAYTAAAARGEVLFGCGGSISGEAALLQASSEDVFNLIFGNKKIWFGCYYCGSKQYGDPCASRLFCPACTAEVKDGKVISTGRGRLLKKGFIHTLSEILSREIAEWNRRYDVEQSEKKLMRQKLERRNT